MKMARTLARTQSGARFCTRALIREMKMTHAAPPISIIAASALSLCKALIATITKPRLTAPVDTIDSVDHMALAGCMTRAPMIAPPPKHPSKLTWMLWRRRNHWGSGHATSQSHVVNRVYCVDGCGQPGLSDCGDECLTQTERARGDYADRWSGVGHLHFSDQRSRAEPRAGLGSS